MATSQDSCHISTPVPIQLACHWSGLNNNNKKYTLCFHLEAFFFYPKAQNLSSKSFLLWSARFTF